MPEDINNLDSQDLGLKGIFGERFHDATESPVTGKNNTAMPKHHQSKKTGAEATEQDHKRKFGCCKVGACKA